MLGPWQQLPLLPGEVAPACLKTGLLRRLQRDIQRQQIDFAGRLRGAPDLAQLRSQLIGDRLQPGQASEIEITGADTQLIAARVVIAANILGRDPRHRQRAARPGFAIDRDTGIRDVEAPALLLAEDMGRQIIHRQSMRLTVPLPAGAALLQPDVAAGDIAFVDGHPAFKAKARILQCNIVLHPAPQPRLHVNIVRLQPYAPFIQQAIFITQIHAYLHHPMLAVQTGETQLPFCTMAVIGVQPGELRNS